jgi:small subunit ribosomal protein S1
MEDRPEIVADQRGGEAGTSEPAPFAGLLEESFAGKSFKRGDIVEGTIVSKQPGEILIDVGGKAEAVVGSREMEAMTEKELEAFKIGDQILAYIIRPEDENGHIVLSLQRAEMEKDWIEAEKLLQSGEIMQRPVIGFNKGGLIVRLGKIRGFVPASQLTNLPPQPRPSAEGAVDNSNLATMVGKTLLLKVVEVDRKRNRLILSEREAVKEDRKLRKEKLLEELREGGDYKGVVSSICNFGVFVDLGGADGLIHLSELSWNRVDDPNQVVHVGDEVNVRVLKVDRERNRIALSLKRLQPEPWTQIDENYYVGQLVQGTITKLTDFGAFARLEDNIEGLVHISELSEERINHPKDVVKEGDTLTLRVIRVDAAHRRLGLSLRRAQEDYDEA